MTLQRFAKSALTTAVISALYSLPFAHASLAEETNNEDELEHIVVWSTEVQTSSLYMMADDIASKQADHVSDLLRIIPGVDVGGAHSLNQRITIRSMDDKDLIISIDGAIQNSYMYHHMGNLQIHADILKSVDIEIGSNSIITRGLGGAVRFQTKEARDLLEDDARFGARAQVAYADNASQNYSLTGYGLLTDDLDVLAYVNDVSRDNYDVGGGQILDFDGTVFPNTDGKVRGLEGDIKDALVKFGWNIGEDQRVSVSYEAYQDKGNYSFRPDMGLATDLSITNSLGVPLLWPTEFTRDTLTLNYNGNWGSDTSVFISAYSNTSELWRDERGWAQNERFAESAAIVTGEAKNAGVSILGETFFELGADNYLTWGMDYVKHDTNYLSAQAQPPGSSGQSRSSEESTTLAFFVQDRIGLTDQLFLIPGLRYDHYDIQSKVVDNSFNHTSAAIAVEYQVNDNFVVKASGTELFKGPEIGEVFIGAGLFDTANQNIEEESGVNSEVAFVYQDAVMGADNFSFGSTFFRTDIDNYIYDYAPVPGGGPRDFWKDNIGDMKIDGFETYVGYQIGQFDTQITFSRSESELSAFTDYASRLNDARIDRQQGDTIGATFTWDITELDLILYWETMHVDDVDQGINLDGATKNNRKDGFTVHNFSASWHPQNIDGLSVILGIDNVFDEFYASQASRTGVSMHPRFGDLYLLDYEPGRNVKATVSYRF